MLGFLKRSPQVSAPPPAAAPQLPAESVGTGDATSIRETIDLLELDLGAMIREVERAAASVRAGAGAFAQALTAIRASSESLAAKSQDAKRDADLVAGATAELAQSSSEIDQQIRAACTLTDDASDAAAAANQSVDGLKSSSAEIGKIVKSHRGHCPANQPACAQRDNRGSAGRRCRPRLRGCRSRGEGALGADPGCHGRDQTQD